MKKLIYILFLFPLLSMGQVVPFGFMAEAIAACTADPNELATTANAMSDPNCNEADGFAGTLVFGSVTRASVSSDVNVGSYAMEVTSDDGGTGFAYLTISVTSGDELDVSYDAKESVGTNANFFIGGVSVSPNGSQDLTTSWASYSFSTTISSTGTLQLRWHPARSSGAGNTGDKVLVDNVSVIKTN